jgi:hypothetical protein
MIAVFTKMQHLNVISVGLFVCCDNYIRQLKDIYVHLALLP